MAVDRRSPDFGEVGPQLAHRGFTLVEMMVSVALVLLMMTLFAQIFQMAAGALSTQKGIAENDQKDRMLTSIIRGDLDHRTFRDVFPFKSGEDTRQLGHSLSRRSGYFEIGEGDPTSDIDDYLAFTTQVNIKLQNKEVTPYSGKSKSLSSVLIASYPSSNSITISTPNDAYYASMIPVNSHIWIIGGTVNDGRYTVSVLPTVGGGITITFAPALVSTAPGKPAYVCLSENEPDFDDGVFGNSTTTSSAAEVCYFLRNGVLYRRVLLIREPAIGGDAQPTFTTGTPQLWPPGSSGEYYPQPGINSTFWNDLDNSAFFFTGKTSAGGTMAPGVRFHSAPESLSNSSQAPQVIINDSGVGNSPPTAPTTFPISLGIPHLRFGHSTSNGLPQDLSTSATLFTAGTNVTINRFTLQECSNTAFGYPGYLANDPRSGTANTNPFDRQNIQVDDNTGQVVEYSTQTSRRGEDILMSNVLTFDVKVFDPIFVGFVDIGDSTLNPGGPFSSTAAGLYNTTYGGNFPHFRFDTWHPLAFVTAVGGGSAGPNAGQPPYIPLDASGRPFSLSAIQITINYRDVASGQVRQLTIVQSLVDRVKPTATTNEAPEE